MSRDSGPVLSGMSGTVAGYRLDGYIGRGRHAVVYLARDERAGRVVALKIMSPELAADDTFRARFLRESRAAAALQHRNILPVYEADEAAGTLYVVMRHVQGGDAGSLLSRFRELPIPWACAIITQAASGLDAAHARGLVHGDVRPPNILLDPASPAGGGAPAAPGGGAPAAPGGAAPAAPGGRGPGHVYVSDFGLCPSPRPGEIAAAREFAGAPDYAAPEQIDGRPLDGRADLYALACTGFELLCGTPPFGHDQGPTVMYAQLYAPPPAAAARRPELPTAVDMVLGRALAKNPADRYPTCGQFAAELRSALGLAGGAADAVAMPLAAAAPAAAPAWLAPPAAQAEPGESKDQPTRVLPQLPGDLEPPQPSPDVDWGTATPEWPAPQPSSEAGWPGPELSPDAGWPATQPSSEAGWPGTQPSSEAGWPGTPPVAGPGRIFPAPPPRRGGPLKRVLAGVAVIAVISAIAIGLALSRGSGPGTPAARGSSAPATSALAPRQARAVTKLLGSSAATRRMLVAAVGEVRDCTSLPGAISKLHHVVSQRAAEYRRALALPMTALANGPAVRSDLIRALHASLKADRDYLVWAQQQQGSGCTPNAPSGAYNAAITADGQAVAAKQAFVRAWNPVAARYGVQQQAPGSM